MIDVRKTINNGGALNYFACEQQSVNKEMDKNHAMQLFIEVAEAGKVFPARRISFACQKGSFAPDTGTGTYLGNPASSAPRGGFSNHAEGMTYQRKRCVDNLNELDGLTGCQYSRAVNFTHRHPARTQCHASPRLCRSFFICIRELELELSSHDRPGR